FYSTYPPYTLQIPILNVTNSLIEDAITGVNIAYSSFVHGNPQASTTATQPIVNLNNAWFNRCTIGILADYDPLHPDSANNAINNYTRPNPQNFNGGVITAANSVFSCLKGITMTRVANQNYNTTGLATDLLHNYLYKPNFYSFCGIAANSSSFFNQTINSCYFDNLVDGIVSYDNPFIGPFGNSTPDPYTLPTSNLSVTSCSFQRTHLDPNSENFNLINNFAYARNNYPGNYVGGAYYYPYPSSNYNDPYHTLSGSAGAGINFYGSQLNVGGSTATSCTFKNSDYGIIGLTDGASPVTISSNNFSGTTKSGIYMTDENGDIGQPISITSNTFKDHFQQGVNLKFLGRYDNSSIGVANNNFTISAGNNLYFQSFYQNPATYIYAPEAIFVTSFGLASVKGGSGTYETFNITGNTIHGYEKGIRGISAYYTNIQENTIDGIPDDANSNYSYGITLTNCDYSAIVSNTVKAEFGNGVAWNYNQFGVFTENSANTQILCNNINGPDVSLKCQGPNNVSTIEGNTLNNAAPVNFWLDVTGYVGIQGAANFASANKFGLDNSFGNNLFASNGSNVSPNFKSAFYYLNAGNQRPLTTTDDHLYNSTNPGVAISTTSPYRLPVSANTFKCTFGKIGPPPIILPPTGKPIALNTVQFTSNNATAVYGNQKDLYRALVDTGAAYYNADTIFSAYMASMVGSSHEKLLATDTLLANAGADSSKINQAMGVNNSFVPTGNFDTYLQKINNLYAAYKKAKKRLNAAQMQNLRSIAILCPYEYGEGVYKARALLSLHDTIN
ncbi:MAG: NosD domain-containing protein, partial [Bacteroidia bacterium]